MFGMPMMGGGPMGMQGMQMGGMQMGGQPFGRQPLNMTFRGGQQHSYVPPPNVQNSSIGGTVRNSPSYVPPPQNMVGGGFRSPVASGVRQMQQPMGPYGFGQQQPFGFPQQQSFGFGQPMVRQTAGQPVIGQTIRQQPAVEKKEKTLKIGYWKIRGLAAACRMAPEYAGFPYESVEFETIATEDGGWDTSSWFGAKPALQERNALMNLPWVEDGDLLVTQSNACLMHLGRKFGLAGKNGMELTRVEQALCEISDLRNDVIPLVYGQFGEGVADHLGSKVPGHFTKLEGFLEQGKKTFLASDKPTVADFHLFEMIDQHERMAKFTGTKSPVADFPGLTKLYQAILEEPKLAAYFASPQYALPQNSPMATYGGDENDGR